MKNTIKNVIERIMTAGVALPLLFALVYVFPQRNHLLLNLVVTIFCALSALEFAGILRKKNMELHLAEAVAFGSFPQIGLTLYVSAGWPAFTWPAAVLVCALYCLMSCAFTPAAKLEKVAGRLAAGFSMILYPGICLGCMILIARLEYSKILLLVFLCTVLANDTAAWFFGHLFGKNNRGLIAASPNKSIAGFAGGFTGSMAVCVGSSILWPEAFTVAKFSPVVSGVILGFTTGLAATVGDLAESALKRSSGVKDSGVIMPGRGGVLDSIDSIAFAAPVFYIVYKLLFTLP